jgi:hypothetical protein
VAVASLGAEAQRQPAPLHERFGETREMTRHAVDVEASLPWHGGWRVGDVARSGVLHASFEEGAVRLGLGGETPLELVWRPAARDPEESVRLALPEPPSAAT